MKESVRRMAVILVILVISVFPLLADPLVARQFRLTHTVNVDSRYSFYFKSTEGDNPVITSVELSPANPRFARFGISLNWRVAFSSILLTFNPLEHTTEANVYYDFTIQVVEPHTETPIVTTVPLEIGHGACTAELVSSESGREFEKTIEGPQQDIDIADFIIDLDDSNAMAGHYQGSIVCTFSSR